MSYTQDEIEHYHAIGKMPDWVYYQLSNKPDWMKWNEQHKKALDFVRGNLEAARAAQEARKQLNEELEVEAEKAVQKALEDLLKGFPGIK